jgi:putative thiamine transport system permease protein
MGTAPAGLAAGTAGLRVATVTTGLAVAAGTALAALPLVAVVGVVVAAIAAGMDAQAWAALSDTPAWVRALGMSLWTGGMATALSVGLCALLLSRSFPGPLWLWLRRRLPAMLATPHLALAIGLAFLLAPSGWLLRAFSPWATGFTEPPPWPTTQDPWGLGLIAALVAKEVPFLLWAAATQLQRDDTGQRLARELALAQTLGYAPRVAFWRVAWPQLWARLWAPTLAVLVYGLTVVDMALVIGPASPPTLAVLAWQWLQDAEPAVHAQGAAAAWVLALAAALGCLLAWGLGLLAQRPLAAWRVNGRRGTVPTSTTQQTQKAPALAGIKRLVNVNPASALWGIHVAVLAALAVGSVAGVWPFPALWPETWTLGAWRAVAASSDTLLSTLSLGLASAGAAVLWTVCWLEWAPQRWDQRLRPLLYAPMWLPAVLWVVGFHAISLKLSLDGQWLGVWLAHSLAAMPYVLVALSPAYLGFDPRAAQLAASLGRSRAAFLWHVKWPLLRPALAAAAAVGFAVSVAQYLPTIYIGAGRLSTVTTEALAQASGGQRSLTAAYAWLQGLLPLAAFALAAWAGRRRFAA